MPMENKHTCPHCDDHRSAHTEPRIRRSVNADKIADLEKRLEASLKYNYVLELGRDEARHRCATVRSEAYFLRSALVDMISAMRHSMLSSSLTASEEDALVLAESALKQRGLI